MTAVNLRSDRIEKSLLSSTLGHGSAQSLLHFAFRVRKYLELRYKANGEQKECSPVTIALNELPCSVGMTRPPRAHIWFCEVYATINDRTI
jgi:hypothetical protein